MHLLLTIIRRLLGALSRGLGTARAEWTGQPFQDGVVPVRNRMQRPSFPMVVWMNVRPMAKRLGVPPEGCCPAPVVGDGGGGGPIVRRPRGLPLLMRLPAIRGLF